MSFWAWLKMVLFPFPIVSKHVPCLVMNNNQHQDAAGMKQVAVQVNLWRKDWAQNGFQCWSVNKEISFNMPTFLGFEQSISHGAFFSL